MAASVRETRYK